MSESATAPMTWVQQLWLAMVQTGRGARRVSPRRQPRRPGPKARLARCADKSGPKWARQYRRRYG